MGGGSRKHHLEAAAAVQGQVVSWGDQPPAKVPADLRDVVGLAAGEEHAVALLKDGMLRAWGSNIDGQTNVPARLKDGGGHFIEPLRFGFGADRVDIISGQSTILSLAAQR